MKSEADAENAAPKNKQMHPANRIADPIEIMMISPNKIGRSSARITEM